MYSPGPIRHPIPLENMTNDAKKIAARAARRGEKISRAELLKRVKQSKVDKVITGRGDYRLRAPKGRLRGRGDFFSTVGDLAKGVQKGMHKLIPDNMFHDIGQHIAGDLGGAVGDVANWAIRGRGDYAINRNSIVHGDTNETMSFAEAGAATIRIQKRESLGNVVASGTPGDFSIVPYRLQPSDPKSFPWLHAIAERFTEYELMGAVVTFESTSSKYSAQLGLGTLALVTQYNANSAPYGSMDEILNTAYVSKGNPTDTIVHGLECDPALQSSEKLFVRRQGTKGPPNLYDFGVMYIATEGLPSEAANVAIGRLNIVYDIKLSLPAVAPTNLFNDKWCLFQIPVTTAITEPPFGPALALTQSTGTELTVGTGDTTNMRLLTPGADFYSEPYSQNPAELMWWISDDSVTANRKHFIRFKLPGTYYLRMVQARIDNPAALPTAGMFTWAPEFGSGNTVVETADAQVFPPNIRIHSWRINIASPDSGCTVLTTTAETYQGYLAISTALA